MFYWCEKLIHLNLSIFDTSKVQSMEKMFSNCYSLTSLNLSHFNTSKVRSMNSMFYGCRNLIYIDVSTFDTSNVEDFGQMFNYCFSLTSINLSNFYTSKKVNSYRMFSHCSELLSVDLPKMSYFYDTHFMFADSRSLIYINFPNFDATSLTECYNMFTGCERLNYINFKNTVDNSSLNYENIFWGLPGELTVCINETKSPKLYSELINGKDISLNCSDSYEFCKFYHYFVKKSNSYYYNMYCTEAKSCPTDYNKLIMEKNECTNNCNRNYYPQSYPQFIYEFRNRCYKNCLIEPFNLKQKEYLCDIQCPKELPLEKVEMQECVSSCNINDLLLKLCIIKYENNEDLDVMNLFLNNILDGLEKDNLNISILINNLNITFNFNWITYIITKLKAEEKNNTINDDLYSCLYKLRSIYNISNETYLYILNIQINYSTDKKQVYEIYYYSDEEDILKRMNLFECEKSYNIFNLAKCKKYSIQSIVNDNLCITCNNNMGFFEINNETNNEFKRCFNMLQGYYLDIENQVYKPCYNSCLSCEKGGNRVIHNCKECNEQNPFKSG